MRPRRPEAAAWSTASTPSTPRRRPRCPAWRRSDGQPLLTIACRRDPHPWSSGAALAGGSRGHGIAAVLSGPRPARRRARRRSRIPGPVPAPAMRRRPGGGPSDPELTRPAGRLPRPARPAGGRLEHVLSASWTTGRPTAPPRAAAAGVPVTVVARSGRPPRPRDQLASRPWVGCGAGRRRPRAAEYAEHAPQLARPSVAWPDGREAGGELPAGRAPVGEARPGWRSPNVGATTVVQLAGIRARSSSRARRARPRRDPLLLGRRAGPRGAAERGPAVRPRPRGRHLASRRRRPSRHPLDQYRPAPGSAATAPPSPVSGPQPDQGEHT